jgi:hypothetical protein
MWATANLNAAMHWELNDIVSSFGHFQTGE